MLGCKVVVTVTSSFNRFFFLFSLNIQLVSSLFPISFHLVMFVPGEENWTSSEAIKMDKYINYFYIRVGHWVA